MLPGGLQVRVQPQRERHAELGQRGRADLLVRHVGELPQPARQVDVAAQLGGRGAQAHRDRGEPAAVGGGVGGGGGGAGPAVHVAAGAHVPLVAAGLPVLQALDVAADLGDLARGQCELGEEQGEFGHQGVLELVQSAGQDLVDRFGGLLGRVVEEALQDQDAVAQLALVLDLALVGEEVVAQVHAVREGVAQHPQWSAAGHPGGHLGPRRELHQAGRPGRAADLAAHLDVLDRVGDPALVDVGELPDRLVQQMLGALPEPGPPLHGHVRHGARPQVRQACSTGLVGSGKPSLRSMGMKSGSRSR